uniref:Transmembrane protein n=1 Tax=Mycena chlorophos TaxID=658473 RepID=A0ABQ0LLN2_MYCCL|nr:predicted protein [Mycena chlorophos]
MCFALQAVVAQEQITLWQFGTLRLDNGPITLPLVPQGTAVESDGTATTFLYQVVHNHQTVTQVRGTGKVTTKTFPVTSSRTIIASASGWFEPANSALVGVSCAFVGPGTTFGDAPALPSPTIVSGTFSSFRAASPSPSATESPTSLTTGRKSVAGPVAGGVIAGILVLAFTALLLFRRRRVARKADSDVEKASKMQPFVSHITSRYGSSIPRTVSNAFFVRQHLSKDRNLNNNNSLSRPDGNNAIFSLQSPVSAPQSIELEAESEVATPGSYGAERAHPTEGLALSVANLKQPAHTSLGKTSAELALTLTLEPPPTYAAAA